MKSFKAIMSEVAQPKSPEEKKFKDMHSYETKSHPVAPDAVFTGAIGADDLPREKAKRKADQEGDANYDKQFKTEVEVQESVEGLEESFTKRTVHGADYKKKSGEFNTNMANRMYTFIDNGDHSILVQIVNSEASFGVFELKDPRKPAEYPTEYKLTAKNKPLLVKSFAKAFYVLLQGIKKHKIKKIKIDGNYPRGMSREYDKLIANKALLQEFKAAGMEYAGKVGEYYHFTNSKNKGKDVREGLDEISKTKIGQYINRAHSDKDTQTKRAGIFDKKGMDADKDKDMYKQFDNADKARKKAANRTAGIGKAVDKLTREELELEISEDLKAVSRQPHPKGGHIVTLQDKNGKKIVRHLNKGKVTDMKSEETTPVVKPKPTSIKSITTTKRNPMTGKLKPAANRRPGYVAGDDEIGESNNLVDEGILDNIKKKVNDVRRKVVGPNQAEKDAAKKKQMAKQHASTMKNIGSAMGAVAKKDKAAEVARLKQGLKNVENQRKESVDLDETTNSALMKPVTTTTPDGKKRTVMKTVKSNRTDDHGQDIIKSESGVNPLIKAVTGGKQKIKEALKANILESLAQADVKETE